MRRPRQTARSCPAKTRVSCPAIRTPTLSHPLAAMSVVPLTLTISLCLVFTFVLFFLREHSRHRFSSPECEALLPLADESPRIVTAGAAVQAPARDAHDH